MGILSLGVFVSPFGAFAITALDLSINQRNPANDGNITRFLSFSTTTDGLIGWQASTTLPVPLKFGSGLISDGITLSVLPVTASSTISDVTGLQTSLDALTASLTSLQTQINGKASTTHSHIIADVTGLQTALDAKAASASLATVATTGVYADLSGKPTIPSAQIQSDWAQTSTTSADFIKTKPNIDVCYEGATLRVNCSPIFKSATVASGVAVFNLTTDGTSGGTAIFPNGVVIDSANPIVSDSLASYQMSWAFSNSNKTVTVTANKLTTSNILTGILGQAAANGSVVKMTVWGY